MAEQLPVNENGDKIVRIVISDPDDDHVPRYDNRRLSDSCYHFVHELQDIETLNHRAMN